jgi:L-2-hydroxyglutarate oxidase LhgO
MKSNMSSGKIIVATEKEEVPIISGIYTEVSLMDFREKISAQEIKEIESQLGIEGIWVPQTGIID